MATGYLIRAFDPTHDVTDALRLINSDRLKGQPPCTEAMLNEAIAGRSDVDGSWWASLRKPELVVLADDRGPAGIMSYATHPRENSAFLL